MTSDFDYTVADPDLDKAHPLLYERWAQVEQLLQVQYGWRMQVIEVYRPQLRQQWLYGSGRTVAQLDQHGISPLFAQPDGPRVTSAWSARTSAHGCTRLDADQGQVVPASAALDVCPVGPDGRPWTRDDPWDEFVATMAGEGPVLGLVHFHAPGKQVWDRPHLQLWPEWSDREHRLIT